MDFSAANHRSLSSPRLMSSGSAWVVHVHDLRQIDVYVYVCDGGRAGVCVCACVRANSYTHTFIYSSHCVGVHNRYLTKH